jgi:hypothetical protein
MRFPSIQSAGSGAVSASGIEPGGSVTGGMGTMGDSPLLDMGRA